MRIRRRYGECGAGDRLCVSVAHAQGTFAKLLRNLRCCCAKERKESCAEKNKSLVQAKRARAHGWRSLSRGRQRPISGLSRASVQRLI